MKKYLTFLFLFLFLASCSDKKIEEKTINTWASNSWEIVLNSTWKIENSENEKTEKTEENFEPKIVKEGDVTIFTDEKKGYEVKYKTSENLKEELKDWFDVFLSENSWNIFSIVTNKNFEENFEKYLEKNMQDISKNVENLKKEDFSLNGEKWKKISYLFENLIFEQYYFEWKDNTIILLNKVLNDKTKENFDFVLKSFKLLK